MGAVPSLTVILAGQGDRDSPEVSNPATLARSMVRFAASSMSVWVVRTISKLDPSGEAAFRPPSSGRSDSSSGPDWVAPVSLAIARRGLEGSQIEAAPLEEG